MMEIVVEKLKQNKYTRFSSHKYVAFVQLKILGVKENFYRHFGKTKTEALSRLALDQAQKASQGRRIVSALKTIMLQHEAALAKIVKDKK